MSAEIEISVVIPLFNEERNVAELYGRLVATLADLGLAHEIVFVDDGSSDNTANLLAGLHQQDCHVVVVTLSRNFGHQAAVSAGIDLARGNAVIVMDGDLQDPPEVVGAFINAWRQGNDVVYAIRTRRKEGLFKRTCYAAFYRILRLVSGIAIPLDSGDFGLMDRKVVEALRRFPEQERFVRGLRAYAGFRQIGVAYERSARAAGESKYSLTKMLRLAQDGLLGFSDVPLRLITWLGTAMLGVVLFLSMIVIAGAAYAGRLPAGWQLSCLAVLFTGAMQLLSLGVVGAYVQRIFRESKGRPTYIVKDISRTHLAGPHFLKSQDRREAAHVAERRHAS